MPDIPKIVIPKVEWVKLPPLSIAENNNSAVSQRISSYINSRESANVAGMILLSQLSSNGGVIDKNSSEQYRRLYHDMLSVVGEGFSEVNISSTYGKIDAKTMAATKNLQRRLGLEADGVAGFATIFGADLIYRNGCIDDSVILASKKCELLIRNGFAPSYAATRSEVFFDNIKKIISDPKCTDTLIDKIAEEELPKGLLPRFCLTPTKIGTGMASGYGCGCNDYDGNRKANADTFFGADTFSPESCIVAVPTRWEKDPSKPKPGQVLELHYGDKLLYVFVKDIGRLSVLDENGRQYRFKDFDMTRAVLDKFGIDYKEQRNGAIPSISQGDIKVTCRVVADSGAEYFKDYEHRGDHNSARKLINLAGLVEETVNYASSSDNLKENKPLFEYMIHSNIADFYNLDKAHQKLSKSVGELPSVKKAASLGVLGAN